MIAIKFWWGLLWSSPIGKIAMSGLAALMALKAVQYSGVKKERARVEQAGTKTNAKATDRRRSAERDAGRVLERYYRDR